MLGSINPKMFIVRFVPTQYCICVCLNKDLHRIRFTGGYWDKSFFLNASKQFQQKYALPLIPRTKCTCSKGDEILYLNINIYVPVHL
jgi:hypothetical protein